MSFKVFSMNRDMIDLWAAFTPNMLAQFSNTDNGFWLGEAVEYLMGFKQGYLTEKYDKFVNPNTLESTKTVMLIKFGKGCNRISGINDSKILHIDAVCDNDDYKSKKGLIPEYKVAHVEHAFEQVLDDLVKDKYLEELEDMRSYIMLEEGIDIYILMKNVMTYDKMKNASYVQKTSLLRLHELFDTFTGLEALVKDAFSNNGVCDYVISRLTDIACV